MTKVNVDTMKPWIATRITQLLNAEDDVVVEFVYNQLEERVILTVAKSFYELYSG